MEEKHQEPLPECQEKFYQLRETQIKIESVVEHIKERIDNGMSHTLQEINEAMIELKPKIEHHSNIIKRIEDAGWWISKSILTFCFVILTGVAVWAIANGWKP